MRKPNALYRTLHTNFRAHLVARLVSSPLRVSANLGSLRSIPVHTRHIDGKSSPVLVRWSAKRVVELGEKEELLAPCGRLQAAHVSTLRLVSSRAWLQITGGPTSAKGSPGLTYDYIKANPVDFLAVS
uniref:Uncharacterized protein n=1 Tax=Timema douglasi TaxID=61478 RepID=A0A7R8VCR3_TIMDO|nr:unnamed protein product [Timema douglasi]